MKRSFSLPLHSSYHRRLHTQQFCWQQISLPTIITSCFYAFSQLDVCIRNASGCLYVSTLWSVIYILFKTGQPQTRIRRQSTQMNTHPLDLQITTLSWGGLEMTFACMELALCTMGGWYRHTVLCQGGRLPHSSCAPLHSDHTPCNSGWASSAKCSCVRWQECH